MWKRSMKVKDFNFRKFHDDRKRFLRENKDESFVIESGNIPFIVSAPHGVSQVRLGKSKFKEPGSLSLALDVAKRTGAHLIAKTKNCNDDANFEEICPYKEELKRYINANDIKFLIDFHGMKKSRNIDVEFGTNLGQNIKANEKLFDFLCYNLKNDGFVVEVDQPFKASSKSVAGQVARDCGIWTIQMEVNYKYTMDKKYQNRLVEIINCVVDTIEKACKK